MLLQCCLSDGKSIQPDPVCSRFDTVPACDRQTDRQTDTTTANTMLAYLSSAHMCRPMSCKPVCTLCETPSVEYCTLPIDHWLASLADHLPKAKFFTIY